MKDHDTRGYVGLTNRCDLHQPAGDRLADTVPVHSKFIDIQIESSKERQLE